MTQEQTPSLPQARRLIASVARAVIGGELLAAGAAAATIAATGNHLWWSSWSAAVTATMAAAVLSLVALVPGVLAGAQGAVLGYLAAGVVRILVVLGGCAAAMFVWRTPPVPTLVLASGMYLVQLVGESLVLGRAFWSGK